MTSRIVGMDGMPPRLPKSDASDDEIRGILRTIKTEFGVVVLQDALNETNRMPGVLLASLMPSLKPGLKGFLEIARLSQPYAKLLKEVIEEK